MSGPKTPSTGILRASSKGGSSRRGGLNRGKSLYVKEREESLITPLQMDQKGSPLLQRKEVKHLGVDSS
jgi:hypothetical protein